MTRSLARFALIASDHHRPVVACLAAAGLSLALALGAQAQSATDSDGDGVPDAVEASVGLNPLVKDNDVFGNDRLFVMQQYRDFLGREADAAGLTYWQTQLQRGTTTRQAMVESYVASPEFQAATGAVTRLYLATYRRIPDTAGLAFWVGAYAADPSAANLAAIAAQFASAPEFTAQYGALSNAAFVSQIYTNVLGRTADAAGQSFWQAKLASGTSRGDLLLAFSDSPEYQARTAAAVSIIGSYYGLLRRSADQTGYDTWTAYLAAGNSLRDLVGNFINALEYRNRFLPAVTTPVITQQPAAAAVAANTSVTFSVAASGNALGYQWYRNGSAIAGATAASYTTSVVASYFVIVSNLAGSVQSATVTLSTTTAFPNVAARLNLDLDSPADYVNANLPAHYDGVVQALDNTPATNPITNRGATLGRVLFHDKALSINDSISCASCHQQTLGFTDQRQFSAGFSGTAFTTAHAMRLGNIRYYAPAQMFWDRRAASVEAQATQPVQNSVEMGFDAAHGGIPAVVSKLQALPYYQELFTWAFGTSTVTEDRIQRALAQFERAMVSVKSRFDDAYALVYNPNAPARGVATPFPGFTPQEERGKQVFLQSGCAACHVPPSFALAANSRSNGLDAGETRIFKSPSLKNVARGGPYMHDGRFNTLELVVEHYNSGIQNGPALDNRLRQGAQPQRLNLSQADKDALVAFMRTLDDPTVTTDTRFTSPFK